MRLTLIFSLFILFSCSINDNKSDNSFLLPDATGMDSEMIIVMDSTKFKNEIGRTLINIFGADVYGLPQPEPYFDLRYIRPQNFNSILKFVKNIIIVFSLEGNSSSSKLLRKEFNKEALDRIKNDTSLFMIKKKNQYSKGQEILYLFGSNDAVLLSHIKKNNELLRNFFEKKVIEKTSKKIFSKKQKNISKELLNRFGYNLNVPEGFNVSKIGNQFTWLREIDVEFEKNIFIYFEDYTSEKIFTNKNIEDFRNKIARKYLKDSEDPSIYMTYQKELPFQKKEINFKNNFAIETRGLWKLSDISGGGPFISYTFVDEKLNRLYYIEGYVYAPGKKKRDLMREIYSILWSFKLY